MSDKKLGADIWSLPRRRSLPEIVAERLVDAIRSGELQPGERVVESKLAKRFGVSRGPLREALRSLQANQLLESRNGHGAYVATLSADDLRDMLNVRAVLEGLAAKLVAQRRTPEMIKLLTKIRADLQTASLAADSTSWRDLSWRFHETICTLSGNDFLLRAWQSISNLVRLFLHSHPDFERDIPAVLRNHDDELAALRDAPPDEAEKIFKAIIMRSAASRFAQEKSPTLIPSRKSRSKKSSGKLGVKTGRRNRT